MFAKAISRILACTVIMANGLMSAVHAEECQSVNDSWKIYTTFDCQPRKILDGYRYTYFLVYQMFYSPTAYKQSSNTEADYADPILGVLYYDKQNPGLGMRSAHELGKLNTGQIRNAAYNPRGGYLLISYSDGAIDLIRDNGTVVNINTLKNRSVPFPVTARNISFSLMNNDAWIATNSGFVHVDCDEGKVVEAVDMGLSVTDICRVGDRIIAIIQSIKGTDNYLYEADATKTVRSAADFTMKSLSTNQLDFIMPVGENAFATIINREQLALANIDESGSWKLTPYLSDNGFRYQLVNTTSNANGDGEIGRKSYIFKDNENNLVATANGYYIFSKTMAYHIDKELGDNGSLQIKKRKFAMEYPTWTGTIDFENFWFYDHREGFHCDRADGYDNATRWITGEKLTQNAPIGLLNAQLAYSSKYGMLVSNSGTSCEVHNSTRLNPILLSGFHNGKWTNYSPAYPANIPSEVDADPALRSLFMNQTRNYDPYPLADPFGMMIDPVFPDNVYMGSIWNGFAVLNLSRENETAMHFATTKDTHKDYPNFSSLLPTPSYRTYSYIRPIGFDADNTIWMYYPDLSASYHKDGYGIHLYYWPVENRRAALEAHDVKLAEGSWKKLFIPYPEDWQNDFSQYGLILNHPKNRNKIMMSARVSKHPIVFFDHNGTPDNTSDDKTYLVTNIVSQDGVAYTNLGFTYGFAENPVTGGVLVFTGGGMFEVDPSTCGGSTVRGEEYSLRNADGSKTPVLPSQVVNSVKFDEFGRCWIASQHCGVYGISADQTKIIAHYTMQNSPIPSNHINDICWNPETKELMISTTRGLASVRPDFPDESVLSASSRPYVVPQSVEPDFIGTVVLYNIPQDSSLEIRDSNGKLIRTLGMTTSGKLYWNLRDNDDKIVPGGYYRVTDASRIIEDISVSVLR